MEWFILVFKRYFEFEGRSRRKEYWMFMLFSIITSTLLSAVDFSLDLNYNNSGLLSTIFSLISFIPSISVLVRRLHDVNKSGWYGLLWFLPIIGWVWLIALTVTEGDEGKNEYGSDPKNPTNELDQIGVAQE